MKKNLLIAGIAGFTILGGVASVNAISNTSSNSEPIIQKEERSSIITMEKAEEIAINKIGGTIKNIELDKENGKLIYEVDLSVSGYEDIEVDIDALSGEIIKVEKELIKETKEKMKETNIKPQKSNENTMITDSNSKPIVKKEERSSIITAEKATEIAINKIGGELKNIELEKENGKTIYEVDLAVSGYKDIELDIDALSGEIIKVEKELKKETKEKMKETNVKPQKSNENTTITEEKAISIALGDLNGKVIEVDFDEDDNEYEIEYITDNKKVEIKIHSQTGKILEEEYEYYHKK